MRPWTCTLHPLTPDNRPADDDRFCCRAYERLMIVVEYELSLQRAERQSVADRQVADIPRDVDDAKN